tara:strand:+ start:136 stop:666 length:531 start_codon:yes stop_codon:yes gene_type:complete
MKLLTLKFLLIFIYLISSSVSYAIQQPNFKNLVVHKEPLKLKEIAFNNVKNEKINLKKYKGSIIIINFWATWCKPCLEEMPSLNRLKTNMNFKNLVILPINVGREDISKINIFFKNLDINNLEIFFDDTNNLANKFSLIGLPTTILINKNSEEFARILGPINFEDNKFIEWLKNFD